MKVNYFKHGLKGNKQHEHRMKPDWMAGRSCQGFYLGDKTNLELFYLDGLIMGKGCQICQEMLKEATEHCVGRWHFI